LLTNTYACHRTAEELEEVSRNRDSLGVINEWGVYLRDVEVANDPVFKASSRGECPAAVEEQEEVE